MEKLGPNSVAATAMYFRADADVQRRAPIITSYLRELMNYAESGVKPAPKHKAPLMLPAELTAAFAVDTAYATAFDALTPGRKRAWTLHFANAKHSATS